MTKLWMLLLLATPMFGQGTVTPLPIPLESSAQQQAHQDEMNRQAQQQADTMDIERTIQQQSRQQQTANTQPQTPIGVVFLQGLQGRIAMHRINSYCKKHPDETKMFNHTWWIQWWDTNPPVTITNCAQWNQMKH